jgi:D-alanine transaminase
MNKNILANWNGEEMPLENVKVSVLDRAFMFGDSVYEVVRIYAGRLFHLEDHLERLARSMDLLAIRGVGTELLRSRILETLAHASVESGRAYFQVTRGVAPRSHYYPEKSTPNILIFVEHFEDPFAQDREDGVSVVTHPDIRWGRNDIKVTSMAANCLAAEYAHEHGCAEVVFINRDGLVTEGSHTSIFGVKDGRLLVSPASANVLPGITKKLVLGLASAGKIALEEAQIRQADLFTLDEMFIAGTSKEVMPVVRVDDCPIGDGRPGPVVRRLQKEYGELVKAFSAQTGPVGR